MSVELPPRYKTIDNLGIDSSIKYAENQSELVTTQEITRVPIKVSSSTQLQTATPIASEFDTIFQTNIRNKGWANFLTPPGYNVSGRSCFLFQMLPSLGSEETLMTLKQRIFDLLEKKRTQTKSLKGTNQEKLEADLTYKKTESDAGKISNLLATIHNLDKILTDLNTQKNRYQRG